GPEGEVAGGVLVDERRQEDRVEPADPSLAVDERDLAEPRRALVDGRPSAQRLGVRLRVDLDCAAALEPHREAADERALDVERLRRADDAVDALRVWRGPHL